MIKDIVRMLKYADKTEILFWLCTVSIVPPFIIVLWWAAISMMIMGFAPEGECN